MRHKELDWNLPEGELQTNGSRIHQWPSIQVALLMDLRDELQRLNNLLHCSNFITIPRKLDQIRRNTQKRKKTK